MMLAIRIKVQKDNIIIQKTGGTIYYYTPAVYELVSFLSSFKTLVNRSQNELIILARFIIKGDGFTFTGKVIE